MSTQARRSRAALAQVRAGVERMRASARRHATGHRHARLTTELALDDLLARQQQLVDLHHELEHATSVDAPGIWDAFFGAYAEFLARLDEAQRDVLHARSPDGGEHRWHAAARPDRAGGGVQRMAPSAR